MKFTHCDMSVIQMIDYNLHLAYNYVMKAWE